MRSAIRLHHSAVVTVKRWDIIGLGFAAILFAGCSGEPTGVEASRSQFLTPRSQGVMLDVIGPAATSGCAFITSSPSGQITEAIVPRSLLPSALPDIGKVKGRPGGLPVLQVVSVDFVHFARDGRANVQMSCLLPASSNGTRIMHQVALGLQSMSGGAFEAMIHNYGPAASRIADAASRRAAKTNTKRVNAMVIASLASESPFLQSASVLPTAPNQNLAYSIGRSPAKPAYAWWSDGLYWPRPDTAVILGGFPVTASYTGGPVIVDLDWLFEAMRERNYRLGDLQVAAEVQAWLDECYGANDAYFAASEALTGKIQEADDMDAAANAVANSFCQSTLADDENQTICLDFYIQGKTILLFGAGDGRGADPNAPITASRVQIYLNPNNPSAPPTIRLNSTIVYLPLFWADQSYSWTYGGVSIFTPFGHLPRDVNVRDSAGSIVVKVELYNGACSTFGSGNVARALCPAIDAKITMTPNGVGGWSVSFDRDPFPAIEVNTRSAGGSSWSEIAHDDGNTGVFGPMGLITFHHDKAVELKNKILQALKLPPGCLEQ